MDTAYNDAATADLDVLKGLVSDSRDVLRDANQKFNTCYKGNKLKVLPQSVAITVALTLDSLTLKYLLSSDGNRPLAKIVMNASMSLKLYAAATIK